MSNKLKGSDGFYTYELTPEAAKASVDAGNTYVGVAWVAPYAAGTPDAYGDEIYHVVQDTPTGRVDFFAQSPAKRDEFLADGGRLNGTVYKADSQTGRPVYLFQNPNPSQYVWNEFRFSDKSDLEEPWVNQGPIFYGLDYDVEPPKVETTMVWRLLNPATGEHLYSADPNEVRYLVQHDWSNEGAARTAEKSETPVYRLCDPRTGKHLYTTDPNEYTVLSTREGWNGEGIMFYSDDAKGVPVHRLYNGSEPAISQHHYSTDLVREIPYLVSHGWTDEDVVWYYVSLE